MTLEDTREADGRPYGLLGLVLSTLAILFGAALGCALLAALAFGIAMMTEGAEATDTWLSQRGAATALDPTVLSVASLVVYGCLSIAVLLAARLRGGAAWRDLVGWHRWSPFGRGARIFWPLLVAILLFSLGADAYVQSVDPAAKEWTPHPSGVPARLIFFVLAALVAPITEELLFRGWIYTSLRASLGVLAAIVVSAGLFALAHWESTHLYAAAIFPVGLALGYVRQRADSIAASITFHALYNGFASILVFTQT